MFPIVFTREAQTLASPNHPNIAQIYGIESPSAGSRQGIALVMELLLLFTQGTGGRRSVWALPTGERKPVQVFPGSSTSDGSAVFSPDGHWSAYESSDAGGRSSSNIYVQSYATNGNKIRISTSTGFAPMWTRQGKQIVYATQDNHMMAVDVTTVGGALRPSLPTPLFLQRTGGRAGADFTVDAKGERFLLAVVPDQQSPAATPLTVIVNWPTALLKK